MKNFLIVSLLMVYFNSFSQTEIGGFTIVTQAQKEELIVEKELKNFAALVDFVVKTTNTVIDENNIRFRLDNEGFSATLQYVEFEISINHTLPHSRHMGYFRIESNTLKLKALKIFNELSNLISKIREKDKRYFFDFTNSIFENYQIKELLGGYSNQNYIGANALLLKRKKLNTAKSPKALYENGEKFYEGNGQIKNFKTAYNYFKAAADSGYVEAYAMISALFIYGDDKNFQKNVDEALKYAQKALDLGSPSAYAAFGLIYQRDKKDIKTAMQYYEKGVEKGDADSMGILSDMYNTGNEFIRKDRAKAKELAQKACIASQKSENPTDFWCNRLKQF